jgi:hypothetical protein
MHERAGLSHQAAVSDHRTDSGHTYEFQARALTKTGYSDWSESVTRIALYRVEDISEDFGSCARLTPENRINALLWYDHAPKFPR